MNDKEQIAMLNEIVERQARTIDQLIALFNRQLNLTSDSIADTRRLTDALVCELNETRDALDEAMFGTTQNTQALN